MGAVPRAQLEAWLQTQCRPLLAAVDAATMLDLLLQHTYGETDQRQPQHTRSCQQPATCAASSMGLHAQPAEYTRPCDRKGGLAPFCLAPCRCVGAVRAVPRLPAGPGAGGDGCTGCSGGASRRSSRLGLRLSVGQGWTGPVDGMHCSVLPLLAVCSHSLQADCKVLSVCTLLLCLTLQAPAGGLSAAEAQEAAASAAYPEAAGPASPGQPWQQQQQPLTAQHVSVVTNAAASRAAAGLSISLPPDEYVSAAVARCTWSNQPHYSQAAVTNESYRQCPLKCTGASVNSSDELTSTVLLLVLTAPRPACVLLCVRVCVCITTRAGVCIRGGSSAGR